MQMISGMHFNYSFHTKIWQQLGNGFNKKNAVLFGVARNFLRYQWLLTYLLGASPIADFLSKPKSSLENGKAE